MTASKIQTDVLDVLRLLGGSGTADEIAAWLGVPIRSVATTLCWLRGAGRVSDGSTRRPIIQQGRTVAMVSSRSRERPTRWKLR